MDIIDDYLDQFHNDPKKIEEFKINVLKNHYYPEVNKILNCKLKNFKIGVNSKRDIIFFYNTERPSVEIIYNIKTLQYFLRLKVGNKYTYREIDINSYTKISEVKEKQKKDICLNICIIR